MPWRLLAEEEPIQATDERWSSVWQKWKPVPESWVGSTNRQEPIRRRFTQEEPQQWQPIETCPKDGKEVLVYFKGIGVCQVAWVNPYEDGDDRYNIWCVSDNKNAPAPLRGYGSESDATHWMPLPPAPADQLGRAVPLAEASPPSVAETEKGSSQEIPGEVK